MGKLDKILFNIPYLWKKKYNYIVSTMGYSEYAKIVNLIDESQTVTLYYEIEKEKEKIILWNCSLGLKNIASGSNPILYALDASAEFHNYLYLRSHELMGDGNEQLERDCNLIIDIQRPKK